MILKTEFNPVEYLVSLQHFGVKLGIERMQDLVEKLGHPEKKYSSVHIAGTNGKGSCAAMLSSILIAQGYKVALYTSPHLKVFNERIQVNGKQISNEELLDLVIEIRQKLGDEETTFFEFTTAIAFLYFARQKVDIAIIEVGLGGRLDATNVITPNLSVITSIDLDHTKILGNSLEEIALEKAGIIKENVPVVCGENDFNLLKLFKTVCDQRNCELFFRETKSELTRSDLYGQCFTSKNVGYNLALLGEHQIENALTVLKTIEVLNKQGFIVFDESVQQGLLETNWPGRLELHSLNPIILLDGAHNLAGMNVLCNFLKEHEFELFENKNSVCIVGISNGKDVKAMLSKLSEFFDSIIIVNAEHRAIPKEEVALIAVDLFADVEICNLTDAIDLACEKVGKEGFILVSGSLYVVGDVLKEINKKKTDGFNLKGAIGNV